MASKPHDLRPPPFYSVVIPTYRRPTMLAESIASVLDQTFPNLELIVVNDDPTDEATRAVVEGFEDRRVAFLSNDRAPGGAGARNVGVDRARGEWVAFLDDDDVWEPEKLARQHEKILESDEDVGLVYTGSVVYDFTRDEVRSVFRPVTEGWVRDDILYRNLIGGMYSVAVKTVILREIGGFDERFPALQDMDLYVRVCAVSKVAAVKDPLVRVRKDHRDRITRNSHRKLVGAQLFWDKYHGEIRGSWRLSHRAASRVFLFALASRSYPAALRALPWTVAGLIVDPRNLVWLLRQLAARVLRRFSRNPACARAPRTISNGNDVS